MKKKDIDGLVKSYREFLNSIDMIEAEGIFFLTDYEEEEIHVDDVRKLAKLTRSKVVESKRNDDLYDIEFKMSYKGVKFCSIHNSEEL